MTRPPHLTEKPRRLGRGLEALISNTSPPNRSRGGSTDEPTSADTSPYRLIPLAEIHPNRFQPRTKFDPVELAELEKSIRENGLLQPITARPRADGDGFELIAGERRLRAVSRIGWADIPTIVRTLNDSQALTLALVENLQRTDLGPVDQALGYQRLIDEFQFTQTQIAEAVGKDRSTVANTLRLLQLPDGIRKLLREGRLSTGHARALLAMPTERAMLDAARQILAKQLSVRDVERLVQHARTPGKGTGRSRQDKHRSSNINQPKDHGAEINHVLELLRRRLQTDVRVVTESEAKGDITITFYSLDDLQRLAELILGRPLDDA